jgi:serralysin
MFVNGKGQGAPGANRIFLTVWDGGGTDTYDFSRYTTNLKVDLRPGEWTTTSSAQLARLHYDGSKVAVGNIANALLHNSDARSLIDNAKGGAGHDVMTGNAAANVFWGNAGNDKLYGGNGNDNLVGGAGADRLDGGSGSDLANYGSAAAGVMADLLSPGVTGKLRETCTCRLSASTAPALPTICAATISPTRSMCRNRSPATPRRFQDQRTR